MKRKRIKLSKPINRWPTMAEIFRFMQYVRKNGRCRKGVKTPCWTWTGHRDKDGYGQFWFDGRAHWAHRLSYQFFRHKKLPAGQEANHTCLNRKCVNPEHCEEVSKSWNSADPRHRENGTKNEIPF